MVRANNVNGDPSMYLEYDTFGSSHNPCILLVMGLGTQMLAWKAEFCEMLAADKYFVVRFDNRDIGLSRHFDELGPPPLVRRVLHKMVLGRFCPPATDYTLGDMATDAFGLLDFLNVKQAHVVGASMGGMIAQTMAIQFPQRVLSLTSIFSTTGAHNLPDGELRIRLMLLAKSGPTHEERVADATRKLRAIAYPATLGEDLDEYVKTRACR